MPELPEVETCKNGIAPYILHQVIVDVIVRHFQLRWPIPKNIKSLIKNQKILDIQRRAKYIIVTLEQGYLLLHLGMSGHFYICSPQTPLQKHDHIDFVFSPNLCLRYHDPRRFGAIIWTQSSPFLHPLLIHLGPEPLDQLFDEKYLYQISRKRTTPIKNFIMNPKIVVGIGNIYANEALFQSKIHPLMPAGKLSLKAYRTLVEQIKMILTQAIIAGGTTLNDFKQSDGKPGYFKQNLQVYGRRQQKCYQCGTLIETITCGQRSSFFCPNCQKKP